MRYRAEHDLPAIPLSKALTTTAGRHVVDTRENIWGEGETPRPGTNYHSWSDAPYPSDHRAGGDVVRPRTPRHRLRVPRLRDHRRRLRGRGRGARRLDVLAGARRHPDQFRRLGRPPLRAIGIGVETSPGEGRYGGRIYHVWFGEAAIRGAGHPRHARRRPHPGHRVRGPDQRARRRRPPLRRSRA